MKRLLYCLLFISGVASAQGRLNLSLVKRQAAGPSFSVGTSFFPPSTNVTGTASSPQGTSVVGTLLTNPITVAAVTGFQFSHTFAGTYISTYTATPSSGTVNDSFYLRVAAATAAGTYTGPIVFASTGASPSTITVTVNATVNSAGSPTITVNPSSLILSTVQGTASTPPQTFTITGTNLTGNIVATVPASFLGGTDGANYVSSVTITQSGGSVSQLFYVIIPATAPPGNPTGTITFTSPGVSSPPTVSLTGTVSSSGPVTDSIVAQVFFGLSSPPSQVGWTPFFGGPDTAVRTVTDPTNYQPVTFKVPLGSLWNHVAGANHAAANAPNGATSAGNVNFPLNVIGGYWYNQVNSATGFNLAIDSMFAIGNLDTNQLYMVQTFNSRTGTNHQIVEFVIDSANRVDSNATLDAAGNTGTAITFQNLRPNSRGIIFLGGAPRFGNPSGSVFFYFNAAIVTKQAGRKAGGIVVFNNYYLPWDARRVMAIREYKKIENNNGWFYSGPPNLKITR